MTRAFLADAFYGDHLPSGEYAATVPNVGLVTHLGTLALPPGEPWGIGYPRITNVGGFRVAGQAHSTLNPAFWQYDGDVRSWTPGAPPCVGVSPIIYDNVGDLYVSDGSVGSQGYRYVNEANQIISGDATYRLDLGGGQSLFEYTDLGGLLIGQAAYDGGGVQVWDGAVLRQLELGVTTFVRANRRGENVGIAFTKPDGVVLITATMAELRALPPVVPPDDGGDGDGEDGDGDGDGGDTDDGGDTGDGGGEEPSLYRRHQEQTMSEHKIVVVRGPGGKLGRPGEPNTGPWGGLGQGWRGFVWDGLDTSDTRYHLQWDGDTRITNAQGGAAGCDATKYSGALDSQLYFKPDGQSGQGFAETWRVYDGNANGALEAQVEYAPGAGGDDGAFFGYPLALEVIG